ncbi:MAG TPA: hypothetical protein PKA13_09455 [Geminicoccaceae bacterium]|nr:hypothetical protein [Geminicoccus sp.]HMU49991.1 hypothetical protein [Geminicoccaceae bacterium]
MSGPRVKLATLSVRESSQGRTYYVGFLGHSRLLGFPGRELDRFGNKTIDLFVVEPEQRGGQGDDRVEHNHAADSHASDEGASRSTAHPSARRSGRQDDSRDTADADFDDAIPF